MFDVGLPDLSRRFRVTGRAAFELIVEDLHTIARTTQDDALALAAVELAASYYHRATFAEKRDDHGQTR